MQLTPDESKELLKGFGFEYCNSKKMYIKTKRTEEVQNRISKIDFTEVIIYGVNEEGKLLKNDKVNK